jgi:hypothetical protein
MVQASSDKRATSNRAIDVERRRKMPTLRGRSSLNFRLDRSGQHRPDRRLVAPGQRLLLVLRVEVGLT